MGADLAAAEARYEGWKAELLAGPKKPTATPTPVIASVLAPREPTVNEVLLAYYQHARVEYAETYP